MKCMYFGRSLADGVPMALFRQNPLGEPGQWACELCNKQPIDQEVLEVVALVQQKEPKQ